MHQEASQILVGLYKDCEDKVEMLFDLFDAHVEYVM